MSREIRTGKRLTPARIQLARSGASLATSEILAFQLAHAKARDAVLAEWESASLESWLVERGESVMRLSTSAPDREIYLKRPDLGRCLSADSLRFLSEKSHALKDRDLKIVFCVTDGLSAPAIERHFRPFWETFAPRFRSQFGEPMSVALMPLARVAAADEVGESLGADVAVIFVGERPGLSSPDSLGIYFTHSPRRGRTDAERNCISNVRGAEGLAYDITAAKLLYLLGESLRRGLSGVQLKDDFPTSLSTFLAPNRCRSHQSLDL